MTRPMTCGRGGQGLPSGANLTPGAYRLTAIAIDGAAQSVSSHQWLHRAGANFNHGAFHRQRQCRG